MTAEQPDLSQSKTQECLLGEGNFIAKSKSASFEGRDLAWEASTLPLSYTRPNHSYFSPKTNACKGGTQPAHR